MKELVKNILINKKTRHVKLLTILAVSANTSFNPWQ